MKDYHVNVFYSDDDEGYIADIPDLDACSAFGRTPEEALAAVEEAKRAWLEAAHGNRAPPALRATIAAARFSRSPFPSPVCRADTKCDHGRTQSSPLPA